MLTRWRPAVWYYGVAMMTRNLLVAFGGIVSTEPRAQLVYIVCVVLAYLTFTAVMQPWRSPVLNHFDVATCITVGLIGKFGIVFVSLADEIETNARFGLPVQSKEDLHSTFAAVPWSSRFCGATRGERAAANVCLAGLVDCTSEG